MKTILRAQQAPYRRVIATAAVAAATGALFAASGGYVRAQQPGAAPSPQFGVPPQVKKDLNITDAQEAKIKALQQKGYTNFQSFQTQVTTLRQQMQKEQEAVLTAAQKAKLKAIGDKYQAKFTALEQKQRDSATKLNKDMEAVLTPAQQAKIKQIQAQRSQTMGGVPR